MTVTSISLADPAQAAAFTACLEKLHSAPPGALAAIVATLTPNAWALLDPDGAWRGVAGLRPTPVRGAELIGGVHATLDWTDDTAALVGAAHAATGLVHVFADADLWSLPGLERAGGVPVAEYRRVVGWPPADAPAWPEGFTWRTLEHAERADLTAGLQTYTDLWGHHDAADTEAAADAWAPDLSLLAFDAQGRVAGVCRATLDGEFAHVQAPGVRADLRHLDLRCALLLTVSGLLREAGATHLTLESWGEDERAAMQYAALGLATEAVTEILAVGG